ncbi:MAG: BlaB/IND/MUS family subclass B1 metallo-beta-lactamase [Bacteroidota bacterium]|nr:BlaB/IND/MUS family subclass B1 metallo-beta-lactamase [Bacteroidota bacterium]
MSFTRASAQEKLSIVPLTGNYYIYTTYNLYQGSPVPANGMYLVTKRGVVLFDTPWDSTQFQPLLDSIEQKHHQPVILCIATHWHADKTAGLEYYRRKGIKTYTTVLTDELSKANHQPRAEYLLTKDTVFHTSSYTFETFYPGEGHTKDNIVLWFPKEKILYAGCLVKGAEAKTLGFLGDGNTAAYASTLKKLKAKYPHPNFIIVTHSDWHDTNSLQHSIEMAERLNK